MSLIPDSRFPLTPADEALELRDIGARDCTPTFGSVVTSDDIDAMWAEEMARPAGYVDAACLGCGAALSVPAETRCGDVLCPECHRQGEAIAAEEDEPECAICGGSPTCSLHTGAHPEEPNQHEFEAKKPNPTDEDPKPPTSGAIHPDYPTFVQQVKRWSDNALITGIGAAEDGSPTFGKTPAERVAWIAAAADELANRLARRKAA